MRTTLLGGAALGLAACSTTPPPPPVTAIADKACTDGIRTDAAVSAAPEKPRAHHRTSAALDAASPCANSGGAAFNYVVFALPEDRPARLATVGARREATRVVPPLVSVIDAAGQARLVLPSADARNVGTLLGFQVPLRPTDRFVAVASDPDAVGEARSRVETGLYRSGAATYTGAYYTTTHGSDAQMHRTGSHEGEVVLLLDWPREKG